MGRSHQNTLSVARGGSTGCRSLGRGRGAADPLPIHSLPEGRRPAGQHGTPTLVFKVQEQLDKRVQWQVSRSLLQSRAEQPWCELASRPQGRAGSSLSPWGAFGAAWQCPSSTPQRPCRPGRPAEGGPGCVGLTRAGGRKHTDLQLVHVACICGVLCRLPTLVPPDTSGAFRGEGPQRTPPCVTSAPGPVGSTLAAERPCRTALMQVSLPFPWDSDTAVSPRLGSGPCRQLGWVSRFWIPLQSQSRGPASSCHPQAPLSCWENSGLVGLRPQAQGFGLRPPCSWPGGPRRAWQRGRRLETRPCVGLGGWGGICGSAPSPAPL